MPPRVALVLGLACVALLMRLDPAPERSRVSWASWIPTLWLLIVGSRPVSTWFITQNVNRLPGGLTPAEVYSDGSPMDRNIYLILMIAGLIVLFHRRFRLMDFVKRNPSFVLYLGFGLLSVAWSDFPLVSFKRWTKLFGNVVMGTLVASEVDRVGAFRTVYLRCAYVLMPLSIVVIKYFGEYGRRFNPEGGQYMSIGVTDHKNSLGEICLIALLVLFWTWTSKREPMKAAEARRRWAAHLGCAAMVVWLLKQADSSTATVTTVLGIGILLLLRFRRGSQFRLLTPVLVCSLIAIPILYATGIIQAFVLGIGENMTFTGRTFLWADVLAAGTNRWIGTGFESFWLGSVAAKLWEKYWWHPNQAHDGYIETYLNLGIIGLGLLCGYLLHIYRASIERLRSAEFDLGRFSLAFLMAMVMYNVTEATFHGMSAVWLTLIMCGIRYPASTSPATEWNLDPSRVATREAMAPPAPGSVAQGLRNRRPPARADAMVRHKPLLRPGSSAPGRQRNR